jgi:hypothetical protein
VLVACMPKSGSSFLSAALAGLPRMRKVDLTRGYDRREQEIDFGEFTRHLLRSWVSQQHIRYSKPTAHLLDRYGVTPVVLTRDLFDIVASLRDHLRRESHRNPMTWLDESHAAISDEALDMMFAELTIPWYFNFFLSWQTCPNAIRVGYSEFTAQPHETVARIAEAARIRASHSEIACAVEKARGPHTRLNVGTSGRGENIARGARDHIIRLAQHYPSVDFSAIGISRAMRLSSSPRPIQAQGASSGSRLPVP